MPVERTKSDPPARRSNVDSKSDPPPSPARAMNNGSPCCGKRPRSPSPEHEDVCGDTTSHDGEDAQVQFRQGQDAEGVLHEGEEEVEEEDAVEPFAKVARSSPVPEEEDCDSEDNELLNVNQQQQQAAEDSKPPARRKEVVAKKLPPLPLATNLREFMKPGATKLFRPRPEWYMGDQNGNPNSASRRARAGSSTPLSPSGQQATFHAPLMLAPDSGLLPNGLFDAFVNPPGFGGRHPPPPPLYHPPPQEADVTHKQSSLLPPGYHRHQEEQQIPLLSTFGRDFDPALHVTIREAATEAAVALLEWGAPVEAENAKGVTPLILAAQKGNAFLVKELLRRGALPSRASSNGTTAVLQAAHFGRLDCLILLFEVGGVSLMEMANFNHTTPLMRAAQEGHVNIVRFFLSKGASVNRRNRVQMTALMLASQRGHAKVCQVLVNKGAELDSMTAQHSTSLLLACKRGHVDVVRVLVTSGCELWVQDSRGRTAREVAQRRDMKDLLPLIDSNVQLDLMQRQQRRQRSYEMALLWNLLQQERAVVPLQNNDGEEQNASQAVKQNTIHQMMQELQRPKALSSTSSQQRNLTPTIPYNVLEKSKQALLGTMTLPAPLLELIAKFIPMPPMWERRLGMLTKRSVINADATVTCALDLIDECLEEGGFLAACDFAQVTPPTHFVSWRAWKIHCRLRCQRGRPVQLPDDHPRDRPIATSATVPQPKGNPSMLEMRRQVGFLQILANRTPVLAHVLARQPYNMPRPLIQQLITMSDIQSLSRRMGSRGVHFEPTVAMDLIMLVSRLCSWYSREREDKPYPIYPAVVHPPVLTTGQRALPMRVPLDLVTAPFQYDPQVRQPSSPIQGAVARERPSAPPPGQL